MIKRSWLTALALCVLFVSPSRAETLTIRFECGSVIEVEAPVLEPGRAILARLIQPSGSEKILIRFGDADYVLGSGEEDSGPFALIGLDLALKPGPHALKLTAVSGNGRAEEIIQPLVISGREFPVRELRVSQEFVTPPPEVEERIRWEAELLRMVYSVSAGRWLGEGRFERPHPGEGAGNFGERRVYNGVPRSAHSGLDIAAPLGSPVRASNSGKVVLARDLYFSGQTVIVDHGLGVFSVYCHFSRLQVKRGDSVRKGDVIALAGSTGRSTGPHLHWAVRIRGSRVDPEALLQLSLPD